MLQLQESPVRAAERVAPVAVVLVEADRRLARGLERVIGPSVARVEICVDAMQAVAMLAGAELVVVNHHALTAPGGAELLEALSSLRARGRVLVYSDRPERDRLAELLGVHGLMNLLAHNETVDPEELLVTLQKILSAEIFGLEKYFPWGTPVRGASMRASSQRREVFETTRRFLQGIGLRNRLVEQMVTVTDELVTNALYNAPLDADGRRLYASLSRTQPVVLPEGDRVEVRWMSDGRRLGIGVRDPYGSLTASTVLDYLAKCFRKGSDQVDTKDGGAGLGLYYVFESTSQLVVNVEPGVCTEMIALLDIQVSYREFASRCKSINIFVQDGTP